MADNENMTSRGVRLTPTMWDECDRQVKKLQLKSRNEFIRDAIEFYLEWLDRPESTKFLTPALESVIGGKIRDTEERLAKILFRMAVEQNMMAHILAENSEYDEYSLQQLRGDCVREVKETNGTINLEKILRE